MDITLVNDNGVKQINAALLSIDDNIKTLKKAIGDAGKNASGGGSGITPGGTYDINITGNAAHATTADYATTAGSAGDGISINSGIISQTTDQLTFTGTTQEWNDLSADDKAKYGLVNLTDDDDEAQNAFVDGSILDAVDSHKVTTTTTAAVSYTKDVTVPATGWYQLMCTVSNISAGAATNYLRIQVVRPDTTLYDICFCSETSSASWVNNRDSLVVPLKAGVVLRVTENFTAAGFRYEWLIRRIA